MKIKVNPALIAAPLAFCYKLMAKSLRFEVEGLENITKALDSKKTIIMAVWHNELLALSAYGIIKDLPYVTIASDSNDGQIITDILERIGYEVVRGSSSKGGLKALLGMTRVMKKKGRVGIITMDGPKGPRHKVKPGIMAIAQRTGSLIIPMRGYLKNPIVFEKAWDKFELPRPFDRCKIFMGTPFQITDQKLSSEQLKMEADKIEYEMKNLGSGF
ncbi:lysophospholipid acyltransferase family protein [Maridesulfovibrio ferrireducens]|uniref:lysophospholipid acyltransferase family protein n=1 Tax=Maridesulfovibrio ferrireducens TaxID=246191 RepID=UPI001A19830A|nr:lysophospholipid acyltransferase family protein [Maridesulfovibrio ferrireducens]MBI9111460.1 lysophospholipid acyltransferase family protein [Maridesulfovibrio ferrireducens]